MPQSKTKTCQNCKSKFTIEPADFEFYKKIDVPEPTFCPDCRMQRRFAWRNERKIYKRKCDFSNKMVFSEFSPSAPIKVYDLEIWNSDKWNSMDYGRNYDFSRSFFEQFKELIQKVPWPSRSMDDAVNSDYSMHAGYIKNCYYSFNVGFSEDCAYGVDVTYSKDSYDNYSIDKCEICYEGFMLTGCYKTFFSSNCTDCQEIYFCHNCINCQNCFGCSNLKHKKYHIFNRPYSKEEYFRKLKEFNLGSYQIIQKLKQKASKHHLGYPNKFIRGRHNHDVEGDAIYSSKNIIDSYIIRGAENLKYCQFSTVPSAKDCYDCSIFGYTASLIYECLVCVTGVNRLNFCINCRPNSHNMECCIECYSSSNLFGCMGLKHKKYCIFNKQYTKEEYQELVPKIKKHMDDMPYIDGQERVYKYGEFLPADLSPHAYNDTVAQEHFSLTKEQVLKQGWKWQDRLKQEYKSTIKAKDLPDDIKDVDNSVLKEVIECDNESKKNCSGPGVFRLVPTELGFYKKHNIPLPRLCFECRHQQRIKQRNPFKLWPRKCQCAGHQDDSKRYKNEVEHFHKDKHCPNKFQTSYVSDRKEIVYCEQCYNKEIS